MNILVVDDEKNIRYTLTDILTDEGYHVKSVDTGEKCIKILKKQRFDMLILDVRLPGMDGIQVYEKIIQSEIDIDVLVISGHSGIQTAVKAVKLGAYDFIEKPLSLSKLLTAVRNIAEKRSLQISVNQNQSEKKQKYNMIGESPQIKSIRDTINKVAPTEAKVLIRGESGTGKELVAWAIHEESNRNEKPFIAFNSAALPSELVESELFGYDKGAFTGAEKRKIGKLELAHNGTLFLDEIGDMSMTTQAKVLRVIQEGTFERVGGENTITIDVRILAATHKNLEDMIEEGYFRQDLFYRLNVLPITIPPLRDRTGDRLYLANHFLKHFCFEMKTNVKKLTPNAGILLDTYNFPGNVRELKNLIERLCILVSTDKIAKKDILPHISGLNAAKEEYSFMSSNNFADAKRDFEIQYLTEKLKNCNWNISLTAENLGMKQPNLSRKMKDLNISRYNQ
ncbi:MAG: sigma-54-dependent Fis family transcriptional regulator [Candidatus Marinimicrobia bacterium]|jgi:two-component system nitrogen regulation response regulator NtrX|nr:sigma-54-dependent Fis family transcriptional regulator [Candidatus Neomarinimicrobiota bacterium]MBT3633944.1 sigma-54-dependent Fis family transcriptional regulator [Candidatus Neomarinimicrobiota bacterium]MBT3682807.1 sigma-54-dependent Fis family transcriptional regulator [Candidatus Neomarinimicrobiota bacterium]MBT3760006.1 sigma-54-dependent Fis family transcriptional regulator [Candidatus Neomarinimicrobiota bacterium]MBT3896100.1 sigma-54-dependent Fis family transcriptional regula